MVNDHCVRTNHAEINAICQASRHGISLEGATAYVTNMPCTNCAKALVGAGIKKVVVFTDYHDTLAEMFFKEAGVELLRLPMPEREIHYDVKAFTSAIPWEEEK
jgi:dCMP deaminase